MAAVTKDLQDLIGNINAYQTLVERWPADDFNIKVIADWLNNGGQITQTFDVLQLLYLVVGGENWENFVMEKISSKICNVQSLYKIEEIIKTALLGALAGMLDCSANPLISDMYIGSGKYQGTNGLLDKLTNGTLNLNLNAIDIMGTLYTSPFSKAGRYCYLDTYPDAQTIADDKIVEDTDATDDYHANPSNWGRDTRNGIEYYYRLDDKCKYYKVIGTQPIDGQDWKILGLSFTEPNVNINNLWKSRDFNAWLWYVINKGHNDDKCVWDNRYSSKLEQKVLQGSDKKIGLFGIPDTDSVGYNNEEFFEAQTPEEVIAYNGGSDTDTCNIEITIDKDDIDLTGNNVAEELSEGKWILNDSGITNVINVLTAKFNENFISGTCKYAKISIGGLAEDVSGKTYTLNTKTRTYKKVNWERNSEITSISENFPALTIDDTSSKSISDSSGKALFNAQLSVALNVKNSFKKKSTTNKNRYKKQILKVHYSPDFGNGYISVSIPPLEYYKSRGTLNKFMLEWNKDYLDSIKLFDIKTVVAQIIDSFFNKAGRFNIGLSKSRLLVNQIVEQVISNVIALDDTNINNCYFSFSNDEYNAALEKAEALRRGQYDGNSTISVDTIYNAVDEVTANATYNQETTTISNTLNAISGSSVENANTGKVSVMLTSLLSTIVYPLLEPLFQPKIMILLAINMCAAGITDVKDAGDVISRNWNQVMSVIMNAVTDIVIEIKDMIVETIMSIILNKITELMTQVTEKLVLEQIEEYRSVLEELLNLLKLFLKNGGSLGSTIDNVNYADIETDLDSETNNNNTEKC